MEYTILSDKPLATFGDENLVAEFDRLENLASFDQIGVRFKDRKELLFVGNLLPLEHSTTGLIDHPVSKATIVIDFFANGIDRDVVHQIDASDSFRLFQNYTRVFDYLARCAYKFAIFRNQRFMSLSCRHS